MTEIPEKSSSSILRIATPRWKRVLKQPLVSLRGHEVGMASPKRAEREVECLRFLSKILHTHSVPEIFHHDVENHLFIMQDLALNAEGWNKCFDHREIGAELAARVGAALGDLHQITHGNEEAMHRFGDKSFFHEVQITSLYAPLFDLHPRLSDSIGSHAALLASSHLCLVHGDFQPSNILLREERLAILDWDMSHFGHPSFDSAYLMAYLTFETLKHPQRRDAWLPRLTSFWNAYIHAAHFETPQWHERSTLPQLGCLLLAKIEDSAEISPLEESTLNRLRSIATSLILHEIPTMHVYLDILSRA